MPTCGVGDEGLDSERARDHPERHPRGLATSGSAHRPILHADEYGPDQVDVAQAQRGRPDPELLGASEGFAFPALLLPLNKLSPAHVFRQRQPPWM